MGIIKMIEMVFPFQPMYDCIALFCKESLSNLKLPLAEKKCKIWQ